MRRTLTFLLLVPAGLVCGQSNPAAAPPAAGPAEKTVEQTASPELVGQLVSELAITPKQAEGAAGTLFGQAKGKLSAADFAKVAATVPNMEGLLKAAPGAAKPAADAAKPAADSATGKATAALAGLGAAASTASTLSKLGLKPDQILKVAPTLVKFVQSKGGAEVGTLLAGALK